MWWSPIRMASQVPLTSGFTVDAPIADGNQHLTDKRTYGWQYSGHYHRDKLNRCDSRRIWKHSRRQFQRDRRHAHRRNFSSRFSRCSGCKSHFGRRYQCCRRWGPVYVCPGPDCNPCITGYRYVRRSNRGRDHRNGFTSTSTVKFGSIAATSVTYNSAISLTVTSPPGSAGIVDVTVTTTGGTSQTTSLDQFDYYTIQTFTTSGTSNVPSKCH